MLKSEERRNPAGGEELRAREGGRELGRARGPWLDELEEKRKRITWNGLEDKGINRR